MDEQTRSKVIEKMTTERDLRNQMAYAKKTAIEEGLAEGRAEGRIEGRAETIRQLLESGISLDVIAGALNLSPEEVEIFKDK